MKNNFKNKIFRIGTSAFVLFILLALFTYVSYSVIETFKITDDEAIQSYDYDLAENWLKYGYPELKALCIQLLTLTTTLLIFSVTFAEKVLNFSQATKTSRIILITGWSFMILAVILNSIGLSLNVTTLPYALTDAYFKEKNQYTYPELYRPIGNTVLAVILGGLCFILGLISIVAVGIKSVFNK